MCGQLMLRDDSCGVARHVVQSRCLRRGGAARDASARALRVCARLVCALGQSPTDLRVVFRAPPAPVASSLALSGGRTCGRVPSRVAGP
mmetsp:Transcript_20578/g.63356  ORF Transcript_20578/g.63356 Transcript_20578/m.63356 type:complete len:89 (-) Transcript_20578:68-334(-)